MKCLLFYNNPKLAEFSLTDKPNHEFYNSIK